MLAPFVTWLTFQAPLNRKSTPAFQCMMHALMGMIFAADSVRFFVDDNVRR